jgi:aliphatic sulfonates family ABC transporter substrate-binding protein
MKAVKFTALICTFLLAMIFTSPAMAADEIRFGWQPCTSNWYPVFVGIDKGFYEKVGLTVKDQVFLSGIPEAEALAAGELDVAFLGSTPSLIVCSTGLPIKYITNVSTFVDSLAIFKQPDSAIESIFDLKGKKLAYTKGSTGHYMVDLVLEKAGMSEADVKLINMEMDDIAAAFKSKQVDACCVWEPWNFVIESHGGSLVIDASQLDKKPGKKIEASIGDAVIVSDKFLKNNRELLIRFFKATYDALAWSRKNLNESAEITAKWFKVGGTEIPLHQVKKSVTSMYNHPNLEMQVKEVIPSLPAALRQQAKFLQTVGKLERVEPPEKFIDSSIIEELYKKSK